MEPTLRDKSYWQKDDCLFCEELSTLEATLSGSGFGAQIRCCANPKCVKKAIRLCKVHRDAFEGRKL